MIGEACDDGDVSSSTNCKGDCTGPALGYTCSGGSTTTPKTCVETCGEGIRTASEACDDGNLTPGDGCYNCLIESGWTCNTASNPSTCT